MALLDLLRFDADVNCRPRKAAKEKSDSKAFLLREARPKLLNRLHFDPQYVFLNL